MIPLGQSRRIQHPRPGFTSSGVKRKAASISHDWTLTPAITSDLELRKKWLALWKLELEIEEAELQLLQTPT